MEPSEEAHAPQWRPVPDRRHIWLEHRPDKASHFIGSCISLEAVPLPTAGQWELDFDQESGDGFVFNMSEDLPEPRLVEDLLRHRVFEDVAHLGVWREYGVQKLQGPIVPRDELAVKHLMRSFTLQKCHRPS